ncbi:MAG: HAMP domain-containing sensor histidine kinase [Myxococcales bacterium]
MENSRFRRAYLILVPALVLAACVLGYYTYLTAAQFERLGEQSIAESSLVLLGNKVDRIERYIISADNAAFGAVRVEDPESLSDWKRNAEELSPSIRAMFVLDDARKVVAFAARASAEDSEAFRHEFRTQMLDDLQLNDLRSGRLKHLHTSYDGKNYLFSYKSLWHRGRKYFVVAHHDIGFLLREVFPEVFQNQAGQPTHNVLDHDNRRVFGPSLTDAGNYVVGRRFPTTLYTWRAQVAPTTAPLLEEKSRRSRANQVALIALSLAIIFIAVGFILYAADKERRLTNMKSEFIATVSHELKTPLSVIRMFGEMLLTRRVPDAQRQQEYLEIICSETERLSNLIENVLDFAALERGKRRYTMQEAELSEITRRAMETMRYRFEREGVQARFEHDGGPVHALVDEQAILLVIINLLDNAVKYGGEDGTVEVRLHAANGEARLEVRDHGPGIPVRHRKRVFERFYRTDTSQGARGSGIGLAIVKRIAEEHGGRVWVDDAPGGGAVVGFAIPLRIRAQEPAIDSPPAADIVPDNG